MDLFDYLILAHCRGHRRLLVGIDIIMTSYTAGTLLFHLCVHLDVAAAPGGDGGELPDHLPDHVQAWEAVPGQQPWYAGQEEPWWGGEGQATDCQGDRSSHHWLCSLLDSLQCYGSLVTTTQQIV